MQAVPPAHLIAVLVAAVVIMALFGTLRSAIARRSTLRARGVFVLGFACGLTAGAILRGRRRGLRALRIAARPRRAGIRGGTDRMAARALALMGSRVRSRQVSVRSGPSRRVRYR